jgi:tetratricopeptide (TPR) repeat protein/tRNA A-37 threonylcarbamoyl transferase component Bud32
VDASISPTDVSGTCPNDEVLAAHVAGALSNDDARRVGMHLQGCEACVRLMLVARRSVYGGPTVTQAPRESPMPGSVGDRYEVKRLLGAGGMCEVYEAFDSVLHRAVALKLFKLAQIRSQETGAAAKRLVREARAMAMLWHRNVVAVHDVGVHGDQVFIAMQLVDGVNLREWLAAETRTTAEILRVLCEAGEGLRVAHDTQLVHRDFKPDNVLVSRDGTARVTDFGLARRVETEDEAGGGGAPAPEGPDARVTRTGSLAGTPAYMAPEQVTDGRCDSRSDQFSFCVTAWEALFGARPFAGDSLVAIHSNAIDGNIVRPDGNRRVPHRVENALRRGLAVDPMQRFATMSDLLACLDRGARPRWSRRALVGAVAVAGAIAVVAGVRAARESTTPADPPIAHAPVSMLIADFANYTSEPVFDGTLEQTFRVSLETVPFVTAYNRGAAIAAAAKLRPNAKGLDAETAQLVALREGIGVVLAGSIEKHANDYQLHVALLDGNGGSELASLTETASSKDDVLHAAAKIGAKLATALGDTTPEPVLRAAAETYSTSSVEAGHEYAACSAADGRGDYDDEIAHCKRAIALDPGMARAYSTIAVVLVNTGHLQEAEAHFRHAMARQDRMTDRERWRTRSVYFLSQGDLAKGADELSALLAKYPTDIGANINLAWTHSARRDFPRAIAVARHALELAPSNVVALSNLGRSLFYAGDYEHAAAPLDKILAGNPRYARAHRVLALLDLVRGHPDRAIARWHQLATTGDEGASDAALGLADVALYEGRPADAVAQLAPGIAADRAANRSDAAALKLVTLALADSRLGRTADAAAALAEATRASSAPAIQFLAARAYVELGDGVQAGVFAQQLASQVGQLVRVESKLIEGELLVLHGKPGEAIDQLKAAQLGVDTWLGHFDLARAYLAAGAFAQASAEVEVVLRRLPEGASALIDEQPTAYLLPQAYFVQARALEGIGSPQAADAYRQLLAIQRAEPIRDPLAIEARSRLAALATR